MNILVDRLLKSLGLAIFKPVVNAPQIDGQLLFTMADDELEVWMPIEHSVDDQTERVRANAVGEAHHRTDKELAAFPEFLVLDWRW